MLLTTLTLSILLVVIYPKPSLQITRGLLKFRKGLTFRRIFYGVALNDRIVVPMKKCDACGKEHPGIRECQFCHKAFCPDDYARHMAWERRHEGLSEESSKLWRRKRR